MSSYNLTRLILCGLVAPLCILGLTACEVRKTQEGELPKVDVKGGQLPKYDVDPAEVEVGIEKKPITVPDVDVDVHKKTVEVPVPDVNITPGNDKDDSVEVAPNAQ